LLELASLNELAKKSLVATRSFVFSSLGLGTVGLSLWIVAVSTAQFLRMGDLGLVSILGWPYFVGLALVVAALAFELLHTPFREGRVVALIALIVVFLFGTASAIEPTAGTQSTWVIAGFVQHVLVHGQALIDFDARFSWPGGFSLGAVLVAFVGQANAVAFLRWFPLAIEMLYLAPLVVIAKFSGVGRRAGLLGVSLFYATNWLYQDYFSPQALNYFFFLVILATLFAWWQPRKNELLLTARGGPRDRIAQSRDIFTLSRLDGRHVTTTQKKSTTLAVLLMLGLILLASSMSHQLTPFALILSIAACLIARRLGRPELLIVASLLAVGWLSLGASNYWVGHLADIFGSAGHLASNYGSNVTSRVIGSSSHRLVVDLRILLTAGLYFLGGVGVLRRSPDSRALEVLVAAPFLLVALQNYGGEGLIRVVLFGLPFIALLAASAILPNASGPIRPLVPKFRLGRHGRLALAVSVFVVILAFALATTVARGGNDAYEAFSQGELSAVNYAYNHSRAGDTIGMVAPYLPIGLRDITTVEVGVAANDATPSVSADLSTLFTFRPKFIILSQSQEAWGEIVAGYPRAWEASLEDSLVAKGYQIVAEWQTSTVLESGRIRGSVSG
jgi:hypothetical protein